MPYIQLEEALLKNMADKFACKVAETVEDANCLIECGFNYVTEVDGLKFFEG